MVWVSVLLPASAIATHCAFTSVKLLPEWFPGVGFPRVAKEGRKVAHTMRYGLYEPAKEKNVRLANVSM